MALRWWHGWAPLVALPSTVVLGIPPSWPRWALMWTLAGAMFAGCKWLTWRRTLLPAASNLRHTGYLFAWPGMDAVAFLTARPSENRSRPTASEWLLAGARLALGLALIFAVARLIPAEMPYLSGWVGMVGMILVLHFGSFHLLSCAWRAAGVEAKPLMQRPLASASISEFWGRRWNTAFRDVTHRFLFRPLNERLGPRWAVLVGFVTSGVVHDLVISLPAGGGYGGPTTFFCLQAVAVLAERSRTGRRLGLGHGWRGRLFTAAGLLLPACLLFHPPFVNAVVLPFLHALGAI